MNKTTQDSTFDSTNLFVFILKKWKIIFAITAIGAIISIITSLIITPKFQSSVILYPATSESLAKSVIRDDMGSKGALQFGEEEEVEQILQILNSDELKNKIIKKYNLYEHYEIAEDAQYPKTQLKKEYNSNISVERTKFMSVRIEVLDKDPQMAAKIANAISMYADTLMNDIKLKRAKIALELLKERYREEQNTIETLEDSLKEIRKMGINNYESQAEVFNDAYAQALAENRVRGARKIEEKLEILSEYGGAYESMTQKLQLSISRVKFLKKKVEEMEIEANSNVPHVFIVDRAIPAEKKAYPVRWLIVVVSTFGAFVFSILILLILDTYRKYLKK
ncbi:polysaccharide export protein, MPA1 family [Salinivirga cyanobacteriivorans]|uniref:Polysaccharide export protein, MPA1 family n=1 Tax=Salinivirga cyanobacteriivorans TaxID=1307839 RepID=A0A0S2HZ94_9BACT|nr:Wzz/FepE/Etk N-terminal domain-containing protein [Salinivirga cyanobacteriivorans]ALO15391.1 polysaccharide export protein, MPA1 family [Salinivirga cyanobacteriivorans]